jgi:UDP-N-acetylglucosamine 2-epimerase (non-hydrolysing)
MIFTFTNNVPLMKILSVVGARPNFMKIAPFIRAIEKQNLGSGKQVEHLLVHTGQHYDHQMSQAFFDALDIPPADIHLGVGSGTHAEQVGNTMIGFEKVVMDERPDWVVVVGDVNATLACSVTANKLHVRCCHIEAGLRSGDWTMPEEINRLVTDRLSDLLLTPDKLSIENLKKEGVPDKQIVFVGNIMIDTLEAQREKAAAMSLAKILRENLLLEDSDVPALEEEHYAVMTLHRPSNVDHREIFTPLVDFLTGEVVRDMPLLWPIHPRARKQLAEFGLWEHVANTPNLVLLRPIGYHEMLRLNMNAKLFLTDSGGLQEECTVLGTPCLTMRWNTERPVTLREHGGASVLVGNNVERIREEYRGTLVQGRRPVRPELWDGKTAERCLAAILKAT